MPLCTRSGVDSSQPERRTFFTRRQSLFLNSTITPASAWPSVCFFMRADVRAYCLNKKRCTGLDNFRSRLALGWLIE